MHKISLQKSIIHMFVLLTQDMYNQWYDVFWVDQDFADVVVLDNVQVMVDDYVDCPHCSSNHNNIDNVNIGRIVYYWYVV